jgi:transposase
MKAVSGLDVHKDTIFACILQKGKDPFINEYTTLTSGIEELAKDLKRMGVTLVAMESTGIYWIPIWKILEKHFKMILVNPYYIKQVPGRKTDVKDAQWIATLLQKGLLKESFVAEGLLAELREYSRGYVRLCSQETRLEQAIEIQLIKCNIRITSLATKIGSVTVMKIVKAICDGETSPKKLESLVYVTIRKKHKEKVLQSLQGEIRTSDRLMLKQSYQQYQLIKEHQAELVDQMNQICQEHFKSEMEVLRTVPGINNLSSMQIIAEIGVNMENFPTDKHIVSWAGLRPRNDESAGKIKSKKITRGNKYLRRVLVQCAWAASRTKGSWFKSKFQQLCVRKSSKKALIAIARKQLTICYQLLQTKQKYLAPIKVLSDKQKERKIKYLHKQLEALLNMG